MAEEGINPRATQSGSPASGLLPSNSGHRSPSPKIQETVIPPELRALMDAYCKATGYELTLSYERQRVLSDLHSRKILPEDITAICIELKKLIAAGTKGFTDSSLDFRNALGDPDKTEERALRLRQREARKRKPVPEVMHQRKVGENIVNFLAPAEECRNVPVIDVKAGLLNLANQIKSA